MTTDDIIIFGGLDQPIPKSPEDIMKKIDEALKLSVKKHTAYIALDVCKQLVAVSEVSGMGLAKALYFMEKNWHKYKDMTQPFEDVVFEYIGRHRHTVERYVKVWGLFDNAVIPQDHVETFQNANPNMLFPIANAVYQGFEIGVDTWNKLAKAPDPTTVSKIVREEVRHAPPRKGSLQLYMDREGSVWAAYENQRYFVGSLDIDIDDEPVQRAIERILKNAGILRQ